MHDGNIGLLFAVLRQVGRFSGLQISLDPNNGQEAIIGGMDVSVKPV